MPWSRIRATVAGAGTEASGAANADPRLRLSREVAASRVGTDMAAAWDEEFVGKVVFACQRAGIVKIGFITEPPPRGG